LLLAACPHRKIACIVENRHDEASELTSYEG
jgi:hypothetical protein